MATTHAPPAQTTSTESGEAPQRSSSGNVATQFTDTGAIPPVTSGFASTPPEPSASDRAFGPEPVSTTTTTAPQTTAPQTSAPQTTAPQAKQVQGMGDATEAHAALRNPTWDPNAITEKGEKGGWVEATAARNAQGAQSTLKDGTDVDKRMVAGTQIDSTQINNRLIDGFLSDEQLGTITTGQVANVNPLSNAPRNILKHALHESWHHAKHKLLAPGPNSAARQMLMAKLWEFRQWHHQAILRKTQQELGQEGLEEWKAAGSTTLTSDIDVNLKGKRTEEAVGVFNRLFKADGWKHESGVVYDVNVYALDFMHKDTFKGLADKQGEIERHQFPREGGDATTRVSAKEGSRTGSIGGGVGTHSEMLEERMIQADAQLQHTWSLVKMRLYMTGKQWNQYVHDAKVPKDTLAAVNLRYDAYMSQLKEQMLEGKQLGVKVDTMKNTGFQVLDSIASAKGKASGVDSEEVKMAASNRLYEKKLMEMSELRKRVQDQIALREQWLQSGAVEGHTKEDAEALDSAIDGNLAILRDLISECAMFSNEAYVTDGAVNHAVVGLQSEIGISQTRTESLDAFNENVADSLKEIARHRGTLGEAGYKAGKYLWRMADAGLSLGGVKNAKLQNLYTAGFELANKIKGGDETQEQLETKSAEVITRVLGIKKVDGLVDLVRSLAASVAVEHSASVRERGQERTEPIKKSR